MTLKTRQSFTILLLSIFFFQSCRKDDAKIPQPPQPDEQSLKLNLRIAIMVGDVLYDSLDAALKITTWDQNGIPFTKMRSLFAGVNSIPVSSDYDKYHLQISKWNVNIDTTIYAKDIDTSKVYTLFSWRAPKLLLEEITYQSEEAVYKIQSKKQFAYQHKQLKEIHYYDRYTTAEGSTVELTKKESFTYFDGRISRSDELYNRTTGQEPATRIFEYDTEGKISKINLNFSSIRYEYKYVYTTLNNKTVSKIELNSSIGNKYAEYSVYFQNGNRVETFMKSRTEEFGGYYTYDSNINPYVHTKLPDVLLYNRSRNNPVKEYYFDESENTLSAKYEYVIDADGYPTEIIKRELDPKTGGFTILSKKTYKYLQP